MWEKGGRSPNTAPSFICFLDVYSHEKKDKGLREKTEKTQTALTILNVKCTITTHVQVKIKSSSVFTNLE